MLQRYTDAQASCKALNLESELARLEAITSTTKVAICRNLNALYHFVTAGQSLQISFYRQVSSGGRLPENNAFDDIRTSVDSRLFPHYYQDILFGALTATDAGVTSYGPYSIFLNDVAISDRTSLFEENSLVFFRDKHKIAPGDKVPVGYRATWAERALLAAAKLHPRLTAEIPENELASLVLLNAGSIEKEDFIEAHIHGSLSLYSVEKVCGPNADTGRESVMLQAVTEYLEAANIPLELT